jgi:hypothetical protein
MSRDKLLPAEAQAAVITALYAAADDMGWTTLGPADRSLAYSNWVEDPSVGGVLTRYMTPEQARSWIKDGPMKEYGRALRGAGRYAAFGRQGGTGPEDVVAHAVGSGTRIIAGSLGSKPLHCLAEPADDAAPVYVAWGESGNFRHLLWAALRASVEQGLDAHVVVLEPPGGATPGAEAKRQQALADRCDVRLHRMREVLGRSGDGG